MKKLFLLVAVLLLSCKEEEGKPENVSFSEVKINTVYQDSINIRAIEIIGNNLVFAGSEGHYGLYNIAQDVVKVKQQKHDSIFPEFRAVGSTSNDFFILSVANPALLYKTGNDGSMQLVYKEVHKDVFYDSMAFWNDKEGIAMGDPVDNCLSVIITRDGGTTWKKLSCNVLPETADGEAAFAASNSNIAIVGEKVWLISGGAKSRVFYSPDKARSWEVFETPLVQGEPTKGAYSIDFYDEEKGIIFGGDYTQSEVNKANKATTRDGGKTWELVANAAGPGYKSSVRYVPNSDGKEIITVNFTGISYSDDAGESWKELSEEGFYTLRFLNDSTAYAAGKNRISRLSFK